MDRSMVNPSKRQTDQHSNGKNEIIQIQSDNTKTMKLNDTPPGLTMEGVSPYWLLRPSPQHVTPDPPNTMAAQFFEDQPPQCPSNVSSLTDLKLNRMILLTAPNMSGKSTLIRSTLAISILANCGLFTPCSYALVPR